MSDRRINEGHPPSTGEWNEFEARQGGIGPHRSRPAKGGGKRRQKPSLPMLTDEQIVAHATWIHARLVLLIDAFDDAPWDDRWTNRLMSALLSARNTLEFASQKGSGDAVARQLDADAKEETAPAARGSITSAQAADSLGPQTLNAMQRRVLELLHATPEGLTDEEMQRRLGMNPSTQRPRRIELARRGMVVESGTRKTASGRNASVWRAA